MSHKLNIFIKSGFRLAGYISLIPAVATGEILPWTFVISFLVISEIIGIIEEFGER